MNYLKQLKSLVTLSLSLLITQSSNAIIVRGEILRKQKPDGSYHYVYGLGDLHYNNYSPHSNIEKQIDKQSLAEEAELQRDKFVQYTSALPHNKTKILVEDSYTYGADQPTLTGILARILMSGQSPFDILSPQNGVGIAQYLKNKNLNVINVDFRQDRTAVDTYFKTLNTYTSCAIDNDIINKSSQDLSQEETTFLFILNMLTAQKSQYNVPIKKLAESFDDALYKIREYHDGSILTTYYRDEVDRMQQLGRKTIAKMRSLPHNFLFEDFTKQPKREGSSEKLLTSYIDGYANNFLDINALHEIYQSFETNDDDIFFIAGGGHVARVCDKLQEIGYERIAQAGISEKEMKMLSPSPELAHLDEIMNIPESEVNNYLNYDTNQCDDLDIKILSKRPPFDMDFLHMR